MPSCRLNARTRCRNIWVRPSARARHSFAPFGTMTPMKLWQSGMIRLARSVRVTNTIQRKGRFAGLATRFVGGPDVEAVTATAAALRADGIATSLYYLGEYVRDPAVIAVTVERLRAAVASIQRR